MNQKFSAKAIQRGLWMGALLAGAVAASADTQVTFQVDMTEQVTAHTFVPGTDTVAAYGTFNGWASGFNLTNNSGAANPYLYTGTADDTSDANGRVLIYKYVIDGSTWEKTADGQNRCAQLPAGGGSLLLPAAFFNDAGPSATVNVTFQVDMAEQVYLGLFKTGSTVEVHGSFFNNWGSAGTLTNDPAIQTTNSIGIVSSNVYVGTIAITGPTNGAEEFKYVMQPGSDWENPSSIDSDYDNGNNRFLSVSTQTLPIVSFSDAGLTYPAVTFQVDMTEQVTGGTFVPGTDTVAVHGTFNGWGSGFNLTNNPTAPNPNLYTGTTYDVADTVGGVLEYKYVIDGSTWEGTASANNRCAQLPAGGGNLLLPTPFFDDAGPTITANVTFQVDMAEQIHLGNFDTNADTVEARGFFNGWGSGNTLTNDPAITTTNASGTVSSNVYVGTFEMTGSTNGTEEFKYVIQPGTAYEGPSANDGDRDNNNNRFFVLTSETLPIVSFSDKPLVFNSVTNDITFEVDLTAQIQLGTFTNGVSEVDLRGDFNGWGTTLMTNNPESSTSNIYSTVVTIVDSPGAEHQFKYFIQPGTWEIPSPANQGPGGNRYLFLLQTNGSFTEGPVYFDDVLPGIPLDSVTVTNCMVTFTVDMTPATVPTATNNNGGPFVVGTDSVYINGIDNGVDPSWWTWSLLSAPPLDEMTNIPGGNLYSVTIPVNKGQPLDIVYKYGINAQDNEAPSGANHMRYIRSLPNYTMPTDIFGGQGTTTSTEISFGDLGIASASGHQIDISWLGRPGVHLQTAPSLNPGTAWTDLYLTDGTNLLVAPGGMAGTNYTVGPGSLFIRLVGPQ